MAELSDESIQDILDSLAKRFESHPDLVSIDYMLPGVVTCTFSSQPPISASEAIEARDSEGRNRSIPVHFTQGPEITHQLGRVGVDLLAPTVGDGTMGGDECRNANAMDWYGTLGFYCGHIQIQASGACSINCMTAPGLVSNNHVIARSDAASVGEMVWTSFDPAVAKLHCILPLRCNGSADIAAATLLKPATIKNWTVRGIGKLAGIRRPKIGEAIRKHGARTGLTSGTVTGKSNIKVDNRMYYGVFSTSKGMGCPGDSGSAIISAQGDILGLLSWGQTIECAQQPVSYFFSLINPGSLNQADAAEIKVEA